MSHNEFTGARMITKPATEKFDSGWDAIWGKPKEPTFCKAEHSAGYCHDSSCPKIAWYDDGGCPLMSTEERADREQADD
jgi:hypothetical protein